MKFHHTLEERPSCVLPEPFPGSSSFHITSVFPRVENDQDLLYAPSCRHQRQPLGTANPFVCGCTERFRIASFHTSLRPGRLFLRKSHDAIVGLLGGALFLLKPSPGSPAFLHLCLPHMILQWGILCMAGCSQHPWPPPAQCLGQAFLPLNRDNHQCLQTLSLVP